MAQPEAVAEHVSSRPDAASLAVHVTEAARHGAMQQAAAEPAGGDDEPAGEGSQSDAEGDEDREANAYDEPGGFMEPSDEQEQDEQAEWVDDCEDDGEDMTRGPWSIEDVMNFVPTCHKCGVRGHFLPDCPQLAARRPSGAGQALSDRQRIARYRQDNCHRCGEEGHWACDCPKRPRYR